MDSGRDEIDRNTRGLAGPIWASLFAAFCLFCFLMAAGIHIVGACALSAFIGVFSFPIFLSWAPTASSPSTNSDTDADVYSTPRTRLVDGRAVEFVQARTLGREITIARVTCDADIVFSIAPRSEAVVDRDNPFIATDDETFDARYAVEGAPREIVKSLLDSDLRHALLERHPLRVKLSRLRWKPLGTRQMPLGWLELVVDGWSEEDAIGPIASLLASRLEDAVAQRRIGGYRGSSELEERQENEDEVLEFEEGIARR